MSAHLWCLFMCSFLNPPLTDKEGSSDESNSVPVKDALLPAEYRGDDPAHPAGSRSDAAHRNEEGRHERGGEAGAALSSEEADGKGCAAEDAKEEYLVKAGGVII